jgi:hypothetical protein
MNTRAALRIPTMRKSIWIILATLFGAVWAPHAEADSLLDGTFYFSVNSGSPAPTGSFVFDQTTNTWTSFAVNWDGVVFNFASVGIRDPAVLSIHGTWCGAGISSSSSACTLSSFFVLAPPAFMVHAGTGFFTDPSAVASGYYMIKETAAVGSEPTVATPEPSSLALAMMAGVAILLTLRKRKRRFVSA